MADAVEHPACTRRWAVTPLLVTAVLGALHTMLDAAFYRRVRAWPRRQSECMASSGVLKERVTPDL